MKKIISFALVLIMLVSTLSSCFFLPDIFGNKDTDETGPSDTSNSDSDLESGSDSEGEGPEADEDVESEDAFESENESDSESQTESKTESDTEAESETEPEDYGFLALDFPEHIYSNYPAVPYTCVFSKPELAEELFFIVNDSRVKVSDGKIYATGVFTTETYVTIQAVSKHFKETAVVRVSSYQGSTYSGASLNLESQIPTRQNQLIARSGGDLDDCVLFVGDSFFNPDNWWTNFYSDYSGKKAFTVGISSSTTDDWDIISERLVYPYAPKAVVMHIGTNDIFDDKKNAATVTADLKSLFNEYHKRMPNTKIYWFSIEPRVNQSFDIPRAVNANIKSFASSNNWLVYIDSASWCFNSNGSVNSSFFKDGIHPQNGSYAKYVQALTSAGLSIPNVDPSKQTKVADINRTKDQKIGTGASSVIYRGKEIKTEYVISGKIKASDVTTNGHIEFQFNSSANRFLLWDSDSDRKFGVGWALNANYVNEIQKEEFTVGTSTPMTLTWKLLFTEKNAYLYINGKLKAVYYNVPSPTHLVLSSENVTMSFTDITVYTKAADAAKYNEALSLVSTYESSAGSTPSVVRVG